MGPGLLAIRRGFRRNSNRQRHYPMSASISQAPTALATATLHLTQILVSYEDAVRLLRIRDTYDWHQRVWQAFGAREDEARDFLIRVDRKEEAYRVIILSRSVPRKPNWCPTACFGTKTIPDDYFQYARYRFSLLANPTKKLRVDNADGSRKKNGRRTPIVSARNSSRGYNARRSPADSPWNLTRCAPFRVDVNSSTSPMRTAPTMPSISRANSSCSMPRNSAPPSPPGSARPKPSVSACSPSLPFPKPSQQFTFISSTRYATDRSPHPPIIPCVMPQS